MRGATDLHGHLPTPSPNLWVRVRAEALKCTGIPNVSSANVVCAIDSEMYQLQMAYVK